MTHPTPPKAEACATCRFWDRGFVNKTVGRCHRYPPTGENRWPEVRAEDWCGEYQENPNDL